MFAFIEFCYIHMILHYVRCKPLVTGHMQGFTPLPINIEKEPLPSSIVVKYPFLVTLGVVPLPSIIGCGTPSQ